MRGWIWIMILVFLTCRIKGELSEDDVNALEKIKALLDDSMSGRQYPPDEEIEKRQDGDDSQDERVKTARIKLQRLPYPNEEIDSETDVNFEDILEDLSETFNEIKSKLDELEERVRVVVLSGASEKSVGGLEELVEEAKQLVTMESEAIQQETGDALYAATIVLDRTEGLVLDISGSIIDMKKRLRCRVKSCTSHRYCGLIGCRSCRAKTISSGFWYWKKTRVVRRCEP